VWSHIVFADMQITKFVFYMVVQKVVEARISSPFGGSIVIHLCFACADMN
jgi:hypothetical protein